MRRGRLFKMVLCTADFSYGASTTLIRFPSKLNNPGKQFFWAEYRGDRRWESLVHMTERSTNMNKEQIANGAIKAALISCNPIYTTFVAAHYGMCGTSVSVFRIPVSGRFQPFLFVSCSAYFALEGGNGNHHC